jgi:hypothetical protein
MLLTYGIDKSDYWQHQLNLRWNITSWFLVLNIAKREIKNTTQATSRQKITIFAP